MNKSDAERWPHVRVGDVLTLRNGRAFKSSEWRTSGTPIIRIQNLKSPDAPFNYFDGELPDQFAARFGDLLFAWSGTPGTSFGAHVWDGPDAWVNQHIFRVDFSPETFDRDFLCFALNENVASYIEQAQGGVGLAHITKAKLNRSTLPAPPLAEQRDVAALLRDIDARRESIADRLAAARATVERLRAAVLAAACAGRLTADWRQEHSDVLEEPGGSSPESVDPPAAWVRCTLDEITTRITSGPRDWSGYYGRGSSTFVMAQNVRPGQMDWSFRQAVDPPAGDPSRRRCQIEKGDILVTIVGANTGDVAPVTDDRPGNFVCQSVALVRPSRAEDSTFLCHWFGSPAHGRGYFAECTYGAGRPHLSFDQLKRAPVALPPVDEQQEIATRTADALRIVDRLEVAVDVADARLKNATRAALGRAFRGELAPTDVELAAAAEFAAADDGDLRELETKKLQSLG